jgi:hypothetical protein
MCSSYKEKRPNPSGLEIYNADTDTQSDKPILLSMEAIAQLELETAMASASPRDRNPYREDSPPLAAGRFN